MRYSAGHSMERVPSQSCNEISSKSRDGAIYEDKTAKVNILQIDKVKENGLKMYFVFTVFYCVYFVTNYELMELSNFRDKTRWKTEDIYILNDLSPML